MSNTITLRTIYKVKEYHFQPLKLKNGMNHPFVKKVRIGPNGESEMIVSDKELNSNEYQYFIPEDMDIIVTEGTQFNLDNPLENNMWEAIRDSELIVYDRNEKDEYGNRLIDGNKDRYGVAEIYVEVPGKESEKSVTKKQLITKAWTFIENDSVDGRLTRTKLLGKSMRNAPSSDVQEYLYTVAEKNPNQIIELYTSSDINLRLLLIEAKDKYVIRKESGMYKYGEILLGATDDSVIMFFKDPSNVKIYEQIKKDTFPGFLTKLQTSQITELQQTPYDVKIDNEKSQELNELENLNNESALKIKELEEKILKLTIESETRLAPVNKPKPETASKNTKK